MVLGLEVVGLVRGCKRKMAQKFSGSALEVVGLVRGCLGSSLTTSNPQPDFCAFFLVGLQATTLLCYCVTMIGPLTHDWPIFHLKYAEMSRVSQECPSP